MLDYAFASYKKSCGLFDVTVGVLRLAWNFSSGRLPDDEAVKALLPLVGIDKLIWKPPNLGFSVRGMELDFGGIGKEYAVDRLAALLAAERVRHALIDLGGDFFCHRATNQRRTLADRLTRSPWCGISLAGSRPIAGCVDHERRL